MHIDFWKRESNAFYVTQIIILCNKINKSQSVINALENLFLYNFRELDFS